jgi:hypothetical protein
MQAAGILPRDLGGLALEIDTRRTAETALRVLPENGVSDEITGKFVDALAGNFNQPQGPLPTADALPVGVRPATVARGELVAPEQLLGFTKLR